MYQENRSGGRMNQKQTKKLRNYILNNIEEVLMKIRNEVGDKTYQMDERKIYQYAKKMFKEGRLSI